MAKVCNPIYDTVFNAIINDARYTGILLGGILNKNIIDVEIKSCEKAERKGEQLKLSEIVFTFTIEQPNGFKDSYTIEFPTHDLNTNEYKYLPSDMIFRRLLYAALDEGRRNRVELEDERIIATVQKDKLEYELEEMQHELTETKNQLSAMIKFSASLGASPDQIAAKLGITRADVEKVINDLGK